ncbi:MAG: glycosyltransferase [Nostocales cyanobacterium 94392]|nr:glycosyltransferase [Nostocales cyanobacterium 94392]
MNKNTFVIAFITTGLYTGGAERMLYNLLSKIDRQRFQPVVISLMNRGVWGKKIDALDIPIYTIGMKEGKPPTPIIVSRLISTVRQIQPDLLQGWMYHGNLAAQFAKLFYARNIPVLWNIQHSMYSLKYEKLMSRLVIKSGAKLSQSPSSIVYVSQTGKSQHEKIGYCSSNGCVIPNATDSCLFVPSQQAKQDVRSKLGLTENDLLIGQFARFHPMKDHANFLHAAALLLQNTSQNLHFLLAGTEVNQDNQILTELIQKLGLSNRVHLLGERSDMPRLTAALDIMTVASAYGEAFPLVLGEAMSCAVPCVVTDVGDSAWIIGNTGKVVPPRDSQALANAWKHLIELGEEARKALGEATRKRNMQLFSLDSIVTRYEQEYENALSKQLSKQAAFI